MPALLLSPGGIAGRDMEPPRERRWKRRKRLCRHAVISVISSFVFTFVFIFYGSVPVFPFHCSVIAISVMLYSFYRKP